MNNDIILVNELLEEFFQEFRDMVRSDSDLYYNAYVFKQAPAKPLMPNIQIKSIGVPKDENLSKGESKWTLMTEVNIYTQDQANYPRRTIGRDLQELVFNYFYNEKGFLCNFNDEIPNLDANVHRIRLRFKAVYDLETGIIYRK